MHKITKSIDVKKKTIFEALLQAGIKRKSKSWDDYEKAKKIFGLGCQREIAEYLGL